MKLNELFKGRRSELKKCPSREREGKHKYVFFYDKELEQKYSGQFRPYPKRVGSKANVASGFQSGEGGATPTPTLQKTGEQNAS